MSNIKETRSAIAMLLLLGAVPFAVLANEAGGSDVENTPTTPVGAETADTVPSLGSGIGGAQFSNDGVFGGAGVRSATPSYELLGSGIASGRTPAPGGIMTSGVKGRAIRFENGVFVYPSVGTAIGYNDNVNGVPSNETRSKVFVLRPEVVAEMKNRGDRYTVSYVGNYGHYMSSSNDDFLHHEFWAAGDNYFTTRARLGWGVGYIKRSDPRGATDRVASDKPDMWHAPVLRVLGIYGAPRAIGRIELEGTMMQKRYDNNRDYTAVSDVDLNTVSGRFFYRFMPKTSLVLEARNTWADYVSPLSTMDNTDTRLYAGLVWDLAAKVKGSLKLGRAYKKFDNAERRDGNIGSWEVDLSWTPLTYSKFDLEAKRGPQDSTGIGNYVVNTATTVTWTHKWASYFASRASIGQVKAEYTDDPRRDKTNLMSFGVFREMGARFRVGLDWSNTDRNSNNDTYDFKRNVTMATLEAVL